METGRWPRLVWEAWGKGSRHPGCASHCNLFCLPLIQGRPLSYKTFLIWVLISIYQGKEGWDRLLSCALDLTPGPALLLCCL